MKNFKRIVSFVMAMVIFASFFCYNAAAVTTHSYRRYTYSGNFVRAFFSDTRAYAYVRITNWAEETNSTDLKAITTACEEDYEDIYGFAWVTVYADLTVWLEDGSEACTQDESSYVDDESREVQAIARGSNCLNYDDHYSIVDFESTHIVKINMYVFDIYGNVIGIDTECDGPVIEIATFD